MGEIEAVRVPSEGAPAPRGRKKWVSHGLSNRIVYGGLHYGARWLPMAALNTINVVGNGLAVTFLKRTKAGMRDNFRSALGVGEAKARELARRQFFEYGRHTIDVWRLRSEAFVPPDHDLRRGRPRPRAEPARGTGLSPRHRPRRKLGNGSGDASAA